MALYHGNNSFNLLTTLSRITNSASSSIGEMQCTRYVAVQQNRMKNLHVTSVRRYPDPPTLPLPTNVSEIFANETGRFTPERARDIAAPVLMYGKHDSRSFYTVDFSKPREHTSVMANCNDTHVDAYDCFGAVSLNGTMQSNVPKPFCSNGKSTHLNMPGGQWARDGKYIAEDMQKSHYRSTRVPQSKLDKSGLASYVATSTLLQTICKLKHVCTMEYSTKVSPPSTSIPSSDEKKRTLALLSKKERFKIIVMDYGKTVLFFHVAISVISLGACYFAVVSGVDLLPTIHKFYDIENKQIEKFINNSSTFLIAYGIHKLMAPIRVSITLATVPVLVPWLRRRGILKRPQKLQN